MFALHPLRPPKSDASSEKSQTAAVLGVIKPLRLAPLKLLSEGSSAPPELVVPGW